MRKLITAITTASMLGLGAVSGTVAAPVPGYEGLYATLISSCSLPDGALPACEAAINAYAGALVAGVDIDTANQSFTEARLEVFALNAADEALYAAKDNGRNCVMTFSALPDKSTPADCIASVN